MHLCHTLNISKQASYERKNRRNNHNTKTSKIQQLILLGLTRTQIAQLVTNGNNGFVQNVYAKMREQGLLNMTEAQAERYKVQTGEGIKADSPGVFVEELERAGFLILRGEW